VADDVDGVGLPEPRSVGEPVLAQPGTAPVVGEAAIVGSLRSRRIVG
jgi:hypothetical protein